MQIFIAMSILLIFIILFLFKIRYSKKNKSKNILENLNGKPKSQAINDLFVTLEGLNNKGTAENVMPQGKGEFGHEITNPIPVNTVVGAIEYLGRLRKLDGTKVAFNRIGSMSAPNIPQIIDGYSISANGIKIATLYLCPYNKKNSSIAPKGFKLADL